MGLKNMTLSAGVTLTPSGGTNQVFADDGITIQNGVHLIVPADTDYETRRQATAKYRPPAYNANDGSYGKDKKSISYAVPIVLASGKVVFNTIRVEREVHPELSASDAAEMLKIGAQLLDHSDTSAFWSTGSLS